MSSETQTHGHAAAAAAHGHGHGDVPSAAEAGVYFKTLIALLFLTAVTVGAAYVDFGSGNVVIALFVATIKATLVALIFMHLRHEKPVNGIIAMAGFLFLGILLMFCFIDVGTRENLQPQNLRPPIAPPAAAPGQPGAAPGQPGTPGQPGAPGAPTAAAPEGPPATAPAPAAATPAPAAAPK